MNTPYVKQFNESGDLLNPIQNRFYPGKTFLFHDSNGKPVYYPNREERRRKSKFNNRPLSNSRDVNPRLHFIQIINPNAVWKTITDELGNLVKELKNYAQRIIFHKKTVK